jgi:hypothetical protein
MVRVHVKMSSNHQDRYTLMKMLEEAAPLVQDHNHDGDGEKDGGRGEEEGDAVPKLTAVGTHFQAAPNRMVDTTDEVR